MIIVSACLAGINCRYDGTNFEISEIKQMVEEGQAVPVCPEALGGLNIPRPCCEIIDEENAKNVVNTEGKNVTAYFEEGAKKTLKIAKNLGVNTAILKTRSPSCGYGKIYDGTFSGNLTEGNGFTAELLAENNIKIYNEDNFKERI